jgi:hypothetical protein
VNQPRNKRPRSRRTNQRGPGRPADPWRTPAPLPDLVPIVVPEDVSTLVRSLGDPPMPGGILLASYVTAVVERAAAVAAALALSAELPAATPDSGDAEPDT